MIDNTNRGLLLHGEGEVKAYIDNESKPSLVGTGTEDYLGTAWGQGVFVNRFQGCTQNDGEFVSFYRFHVCDPIFFQDSCKVELQDIGGCPKAAAKELVDHGMELIPTGADIGGEMIHLYRRNWNWEELPENAFVTFYRRDSFSATAYYYLEKR
ncbi:MAG: DUF2961 domain-containing protein [Oscillospiraceae bacterium]